MRTTIYKLSDEDYANLAAEMRGKLTMPCYFTGVIEVIGREDVIIRLTASLILHRNRPNSRDRYEVYDPICAVSAVWWDAVCEDDEGIIWDDFNFERFTQHLIEKQ